MFLDLFYLTAFNILSLLYVLGVFDYYLMGGISFLFQSISIMTLHSLICTVKIHGSLLPVM